MCVCARVESGDRAWSQSKPCRLHIRSSKPLGNVQHQAQIRDPTYSYIGHDYTNKGNNKIILENFKRKKLANKRSLQFLNFLQGIRLMSFTVATEKVVFMVQKKSFCFKFRVATFCHLVLQIAMNLLSKLPRCTPYSITDTADKLSLNLLRLGSSTLPSNTHTFVCCAAALSYYER